MRRPAVTSSTRLTRILQGLLAYLVLNRRRLHPRDSLASLFWGDAPDAKARSRLSTALWRLRKILEPDGVARGTYLLGRRTGGPVGFNADSRYWLDVEQVERQASALRRPDAAASIAELDGAVRLYRGDLLEGWYDDWALRERERVRLLYLRCVRALMRRHRRHGDFLKALECGTLILARDPLREEIHREMIDLHLAMGERGLALRQYERCRQLLADELAVEPMAETRALVEQWLPGSAPLPPRPATDDADPGLLTPLRHAAAALEQARRQMDRAMAAVERRRRRRSPASGRGSDDVTRR